MHLLEKQNDLRQSLVLWKKHKKCAQKDEQISVSGVWKTILNQKVKQDVFCSAVFIKVLQLINVYVHLTDLSLHATTSLDTNTVLEKLLNRITSLKRTIA